MLDDLQRWVLKIYESCIGENLVEKFYWNYFLIYFWISGKNFHNWHASPHWAEDGEADPAAGVSEPREGGVGQGDLRGWEEGEGEGGQDGEAEEHGGSEEQSCSG